VNTLPRVGERIAAWQHHVAVRDAITWTKVLRDSNPIHVDPLTVARLGLGDRPVNPGPANIAYFYNTLASAFPTGDPRNVSTRLTGIVYVGDTVEVSGTVVGVETVSGVHHVRCELVMRAGADHRPVATAIADVHFDAGGSRAMDP
jgi:acyl dehydratase